MIKLHHKIYEAINNGIQKALIIDNGQNNDVSINWHNKNVTTEFVPYELRMVDMGTDILWAEYNLGAFPGNTPKDWYGNYYAWGETEPKEKFSKENYLYYRDGYFIKYRNGLKVQLAPEDDAATVVHSSLKTPSIEDYGKLISVTTHEWIENYKGINGLNGVLFMAVNRNTLFFPAAGCYFIDDTTCHYRKQYCYMWTSQLFLGGLDISIQASILNFSTNETSLSCSYRYNGCSIRPIKNKQNL